MRGKETLVFGFPLRPVLLLTAIFYLNFLSRVVIAPLLPIIEGEFGLGHTQAGSLFLFVAAGYCTGLFGSPFISSRLNHRRTILLASIAVGGVMLIVSRSASVSAMHSGLFAIGVSAGLYLPSGIAMLTDVVSKEHWGKTLAIHELAPNMAFVTTPLLVEVLLTYIPWRGIIAILGASSILIGFLFLLFGEGGRQKSETPNLETLKKILGNPSFWIMAAVFSQAVGGSLGVYTMLPVFLVDEVGMGRELANALVGSSRAFSVLILLLSGMITDRIGLKRATVAFLAIMGALTLMLGILHGRVITLVLVFLQPTAAVSIFPAGLAMVSLIFPSNLRSVAMSLVGIVGFLFGGGFIPQIIGYFAEVFSFSFSFFFVGVLVLATLPLLSYLRTSQDFH